MDVQGQQSSAPTRDNRGHDSRRHTFGLGSDQRQHDHEVLDIARVVRVVKGGRRFRFRVTVLVGDRAGRVGFGIGKSKDVQQAIQKAQNQATRNLAPIAITDAGTIKHQVEARFKGGRVMLRPARPGTGIIAGGVIRTLADLAGIKDLVSKSSGSPNKISVVQATLRALADLS